MLVGQRSKIPHESDFILVTQVTAIICCLLFLFITQYGSCTLRPPRLLLCYFPLHRRQTSSADMTSALLSSTTMKNKLLKDYGSMAAEQVGVQFSQNNTQSWFQKMLNISPLDPQKMNTLDCSTHVLMTASTRQGNASTNNFCASAGAADFFPRHLT